MWVMPVPKFDRWNTHGWEPVLTWHNLVACSWYPRLQRHAACMAITPGHPSRKVTRCTQPVNQCLRILLAARPGNGRSSSPSLIA